MFEQFYMVRENSAEYTIRGNNARVICWVIGKRAAERTIARLYREKRGK